MQKFNIPESIQQNQYCRQLFKSNQFECDVPFYQKLLKQLSDLQIWNIYDQIKPIHQKVNEILQLTLLHSKSLDQVNDQAEGLQLSQKLRMYLVNLNTNSVKQAIYRCNLMNKKSISRKVISILMATQENIYYKQILSRICQTIYNPRLKTENIISLGIFNIIKMQKINQTIISYKFVIEKSLLELKKFIQLTNTLNETIEDEVLQTQKFLNYIEGTKKIFVLTNKFYQILKVIDGQSNYKFKLNNLKVEINNKISRFSMKNKNIKILQQIHPLSLNQKYRQSFIQYLIDNNQSKLSSIKSSLCFLCMTQDNLTNWNNSNKFVHICCWNFFRMIFRQ